MLYCTTAEDLLPIGSDVREFAGTPAQLTAAVAPDFDGFEIVGWTPADFGDCWVKLHREPVVDDDGLADIDGIKCNVEPPGTHPGGHAWWLTPAEPVLVPVLRWTDLD
jgi:hypothetical protein